MKIRTIACALLLAVMPVAAAAAQGTPDDYRASAAQAMRAGRYAAAAAAYEKLVALQPDDASAYEGLAKAYTKLGRSADAAAAYEKQADLLVNGAGTATAPAPAATAAPARAVYNVQTPVTRAPAINGDGQLAVAHYSCGLFSGGRLQTVPGLSVLAGNRYRADDGTSGRYVYDVGAKLVTFHGGSLDGEAAHVEASPRRTYIQVYNAARTNTTHDCEPDAR